jgi:hypothetical protein
MKRLLLAACLLVASALPAGAQPFKMHIANGRVTLDAVNVSARQILAEWARIGGTKVVGAEKITGAPLTLKLVDMPERQALDIILRNVAGFMAAPRSATSLAGASTYDRILVMATSAGATQAANTSNRPGAAGGGQNAAAMNGTQRRVPLPNRPPGLPPSPADEDPDEEDDDTDDQQETMNQPVFTFPGPGSQMPGANQPVFTPIQNGQTGQPFQPNAYNPTPAGYQQQGTPVISLQPGPNGPTIYNFVPNGNAPAIPGTSTTFGVVGAPTPGMIQQPTQPGQPGQQPPQTQRPPR